MRIEVQLQFKRIGRLALIGLLVLSAPLFARQGDKGEDVDCVKLLRKRNLFAKWDSLAPEVQKALWAYFRGYTELDTADMHRSLREAIEDARAEVKRNLGYLPELRRIEVPYAPFVLSDVKLFAKGTRVFNRNTAIASNTYRLERDDYDVLVSNDTEVDEEYRKNGLSRLMLGETLATHPWVKKIAVEELQVSNEKAFVKEYEKSGDCEGAIEETAAYKKFAFFGFTKFVRAKCTEMDKGQVFVRFTVKRT